MPVHYRMHIVTHLDTVLSNDTSHVEANVHVHDVEDHAAKSHIGEIGSHHLLDAEMLYLSSRMGRNKTS